jgi:hypothetical protein
MGEFARERTEEEQRQFERGREIAQARIAEVMSQPVPAATPAPEAWLVPDQLRALPKGDRGTWFRATPAGRLAAVVSPDPPGEQAEEAKRAREWADNYEYTYGRRPGLVQARAAVARRSDGVFLSGDARDLAPVFRQAGMRYSVTDTADPLPAEPAGVIFEPVTRG